MSQQVLVSTDVAVDLKPLLEAAIRAELHLLALSLERTANHLQTFETQYGLTSDVFRQRFESGELNESLDYIEWAGEIQTYRLLQTHQKALQSVHFQ